MVCSASAIEEGQALLPAKAGQRSPPYASLPATAVKAGVVTVPSPGSPGVRRPCMEGLLLIMHAGGQHLNPSRHRMPLQAAPGMCCMDRRGPPHSAASLPP